MTRRSFHRAALGLAVFAVSAGVAGCAGAPPADPSGTVAIERFFQGASVSRGEIATFFFWREAFTADFVGRDAGAGAADGEGVTLALDERFHFADGERLQRWSLRALPGGRYAGTVETEDGEGRLAPPVTVAGYRTSRGAVLDYDGYAPGGGSTLLHFRHVMEARDDGTVSNRVRISKFGLPIAGADVVFSKPPEG